MMKSQTVLSPKDWEALSAYLDGALIPKQRAQIELRLEKEAGLRDGLRELRRTRAVLRSQPRLRAPRNFTLTPQMAGMRGRKRSQPAIFPALRLASVLATIFFVVVLAGELAARSMEPAIVAQSPVSAPGPWAGGMGGGGGGGAEAGMDMQMKEAAPEEAAPLVEESPVITETLVLTPTPLGTAEAALLEGESAPSDRAAQQEAQNEAAIPWWLLRVLQATLALLAVGAGVGAWYLRRSAQR